jgi:hypothetical protein
MKIKNKNALGNPAIVAAALNSDAAKERIKASNEIATKTLPFVLKTVFFIGIGVFAYYKITHRFTSLSENKNYPQSNITDNQAKAKADTIYEAMLGFGNGFEIVKNAIAGLNYNAWIKLYNSFGSRQGSIPFSEKMTLTEWFNDQFSVSELEQLRFLVPNVFKQSN